jgi:hypothetical protein
VLPIRCIEITELNDISPKRWDGNVRWVKRNKYPNKETFDLFRATACHFIHVVIEDMSMEGHAKILFAILHTIPEPASVR